MKTVTPLIKRNLFAEREERASDGFEKSDPIRKKMNSTMERVKEEAIKYFVCRKP